MHRLAQRSGMRRQLRWPNSDSIAYDFMIKPSLQPYSFLPSFRFKQRVSIGGSQGYFFHPRAKRSFDQ